MCGAVILSAWLNARKRISQSLGQMVSPGRSIFTRLLLILALMVWIEVVSISKIFGRDSDSNHFLSRTMLVELVSIKVCLIFRWSLTSAIRICLQKYFRLHIMAGGIVPKTQFMSSTSH